MELPNHEAIYQKALEQAKASAQPAIAAAQSGYDTNVGQINQQQTQQVGDTELALTREFGRRGIAPQSGLFDQTRNEKLTPIRQYYTGQLNQAASQRDSTIANLNNDYQSRALQAAQNLYGQQLGAYNSDLDRQAAAHQAALGRSSAASLQNQQLQAQANAAKQFQDAQNSSLQKQYSSGALSYLTGAAFNNPNSTVDSHELDMAYQYLLNQNLSKNDALSTIKNAFSSQGLSPWNLSGDAKKFYGL